MQVFPVKPRITCVSRFIIFFSPILTRKLHTNFHTSIFTVFHPELTIRWLIVVLDMRTRREEKENVKSQISLLTLSKEILDSVKGCTLKGTSEKNSRETEHLLIRQTSSEGNVLSIKLMRKDQGKADSSG